MLKQTELINRFHGHHGKAGRDECIVRDCFLRFGNPKTRRFTFLLGFMRFLEQWMNARP